MSMLSVSSDVLDSGDEDSSEEDDGDVESLIVKQSVCCLESEAVTLPDKLVLESEASGGEDSASEAGESSLEVQSPPDPGTECPVTESMRELLPDTEAICLQDQSVSLTLFCCLRQSKETRRRERSRQRDTRRNRWRFQSWFLFLKR